MKKSKRFHFKRWGIELTVTGSVAVLYSRFLSMEKACNAFHGQFGVLWKP